MIPLSSCDQENVVTGDRAIETLREAVRLSPENIPLRRHLAESLLGLGRADLAEAEFREALALAPEDAALKVGLAGAFAQQGKNTLAVVILEDVTRRPDAPPRAFVAYGRLLFHAGDVQEAVKQYRRGVEADPTVADTEFAERLGIRVEREEESSGYDPDSDNDETTDEVVEGRVRSSWGEEGSGLDIELERPNLKFADVGGMDGVKEEIRMKIIHPLNHPELYKAYGKAIGGGILLYGPPGCGKTHLARATAGEIRAGFLAVGINDVLEMWIGNSERNLHALFEQARENKPCVLFFDEVDALAASRADMRSSGGRQLINQFLAELDGIGARNDGVLVLAATNAPWHLDPAFRRPGRFDRILFVPPPDAPARAGILRLLCRGKPLADVDFEHIGKKTDNLSGADLKAIVDVAVEAKLREAMKAGVPKPLTTKDLLAAAASVKPSTREWFATARNYALYSNQGGIYDDILKYLKIG
jgi:transitional endoplasmic reticulum ATPase